MHQHKHQHFLDSLHRWTNLYTVCQPTAQWWVLICWDLSSFKEWFSCLAGPYGNVRKLKEQEKVTYQIKVIYSRVANLYGKVQKLEEQEKVIYKIKVIYSRAAYFILQEREREIFRIW